jgi:tmRNA-binding protein
VFTKDEFRVLILGVDKAGKTVVALSLYFSF